MRREGSGDSNQELLLDAAAVSQGACLEALPIRVRNIPYSRRISSRVMHRTYACATSDS
jgi:hypothetical protein